MNSITETGYLRVSLEISQDGPMSKERAEVIKKEIMHHLKSKNIAYSGKFQYINIETFETEKSSGILDTSSRGDILPGTTN